MTRSENMSKVKNKNTKLEVYIRKLLWHEGFRYRTNYKNLSGKPDIYLPKHKTAIFVNGCFWHMHEDCKFSTVPRTNYDFWKAKLEGNVERDGKNYKELKDMGINVIVVWGCEIKEMIKDYNKERNTIHRLTLEIVERLS
ncbi:MAG TPA: DNA mismatch endonuclease Vsr [Bacteroidetes bacterium]|nr:DNA mismatch endonuclease Vsr [Bacteroidota bacterium]